MTSKASDGRVMFAQHLRGVAALCVVWLHLGVSYWMGQGFVHHTMGVPQPSLVQAPPWWAQASHWLQTFGAGSPYLDLGAFGVALFFLISGFVIPLSLNRLGPARFLWARLLRIYPVYWGSLLLWPLCWTLAVIVFGHGVGGRPELSAWQWVAHFFMVGDWLGLPPIDMVSWTLQIELRFYLVIAIFYNVVRRSRLRFVWMFWGLALCAGLLNFGLVRAGILPRLDPLWGFVLNQNLKQLAFVGYILSGYVLYLYWKGHLPRGSTLASILAVQVAFVLMMQLCGVKGSALKVLVLNQLLATGVFVCAMHVSWRWANRSLNFLADISYPLYTVHLVVGWMGLALLSWAGLSPGFAMLAVFAIVILVAWGIHLMIERPTLHLLDRLKRSAGQGHLGQSAQSCSGCLSPAASANASSPQPVK
jgi:peptidoglycan/LPS O-acetylase OafA/YrhL